MTARRIVALLAAVVLAAAGCGRERPEDEPRPVVTAKLHPAGWTDEPMYVSVFPAGSRRIPDDVFKLWVEGWINGWYGGPHLVCVPPSVWREYEVGDVFSDSLPDGAWMC